MWSNRLAVFAESATVIETQRRLVLLTGVKLNAQAATHASTFHGEVEQSGADPNAARVRSDEQILDPAVVGAGPYRMAKSQLTDRHRARYRGWRAEQKFAIAAGDHAVDGRAK
jgi:xanthine/CO dehydrogenase XdhC/CoxF family maturation factor